MIDKTTRIVGASEFNFYDAREYDIIVRNQADFDNINWSVQHNILLKSNVVIEDGVSIQMAAGTKINCNYRTVTVNFNSKSQSGNRISGKQDNIFENAYVDVVFNTIKDNTNIIHNVAYVKNCHIHLTESVVSGTENKIVSIVSNASNVSDVAILPFSSRMFSAYTYFQGFYKSENIERCSVHVTQNDNIYITGISGFVECSYLKNCKITGSVKNAYKGCTDLDSCSANIITDASGYYTSFVSCTRVVDCTTVFNLGRITARYMNVNSEIRGYSSCTSLYNCVSQIDVGGKYVNYIGFSSCQLLKNCEHKYSTARSYLSYLCSYIGFQECTNLDACFSGGVYENTSTSTPDYAQLGSAFISCENMSNCGVTDTNYHGAVRYCKNIINGSFFGYYPDSYFNGHSSTTGVHMVMNCERVANSSVDISWQGLGGSIKPLFCSGVWATVGVVNCEVTAASAFNNSKMTVWAVAQSSCLSNINAKVQRNSAVNSPIMAYMANSFMDGILATPIPNINDMGNNSKYDATTSYKEIDMSF